MQKSTKHTVQKMATEAKELGKKKTTKQWGSKGDNKGKEWWQPSSYKKANSSSFSTCLLLYALSFYRYIRAP